MPACKKQALSSVVRGESAFKVRKEAAETDCMNEKELVDGIARKDEAAARALVEQYGGLLRAVIRRHAPGMDEEDLLADALLAVWQNIPRFDRRGSFKNWAAAVARYRAIDAVRKAARSLPVGEAAQMEALGGGTLDEYLTLELEDLFRGLSAADRELLMARYYYGETAEGLAARKGVTVGALNTRLTRARQRLARQMQERRETL